MNVVVVNDFAYVNGGAAQVAIASANALARRRHAVTLFCAVGPIDPTLHEAGVEVVCTDQHEIVADPNRLRAATQGAWNRAAAAQFTALLDRFERRNTVVHVHGWTKALSSSVVRAAIGREFPVVLTMHDYFLACPNGGFLDYPNARPCTAKPLSARCILKACDSRSYAQKLWRTARQVVQQTVGLVPRGIRHFIAVSDLSYDVLRSYLPPGNRVHRVDCPVETKRELPTVPGANAPFVFVGRLAPEKGVTLLARCAREIGAPLMVIGDGPERERVRAAHDGALVTGWLPRAAVATLLKTARALVFPSVWYETLGLVVLEAAAVGVPAIVSDCSAARDLVVDGVTGLWFQSGRSEHLVAQMRRLRDEDTANRFGLAAYERYWRRPHTIEKHVDGLETCYDEALRHHIGGADLQCV